MQQALRVGICLSLSTALAAHGVRRNSLSRWSGAVAAFAVGVIHIYTGLQPAALLLLFYFSSSKITKYKAHVKAKIEHDFREGGQRTAYQVLANSIGGSLLCITLGSELQALTRRRLLSAFMAHYAAACSDTWSSELGILSRSRPRLILSGKAVPKGTNGAVSLLGLAAGLAGGALIGASFWVASLGDTNWGQQPIGLVKSVASGLLWGLIGTLLDSLLGAVLQNSTVVPPDGKVASKPASGGVHISGYDVLTNEAVNFVTVNATAALAGFVPL